MPAAVILGSALLILAFLIAADRRSLRPDHTPGFWTADIDPYDLDAYLNGIPPFDEHLVTKPPE